MRVLHVNKFLYRRGGAEGYLFDLAALQRARGDEVAYFGMAHPDNDSPQRYGHFFPPYVQLEPPPPGLAGRAAAVGRMLHSPASRRGLASVIADFRPDVVHAHNVYHQLSPSVLRAAADAGVPCVLTMHDYKLACPSYQLLAGRAICDACVTGGPWQAVRTRCKDGSLGRSAVLAAETWLHRVTDAYGPVRAFVSPSRFLAEVMRAAGVYPDRLRVVSHFVDGAVIAPAAGPGDGVVFAGRLVPEKGVDTLIAAAALGGFRVDVAGEGPARPELERQATAEAPGRVTFHGRLGKDDLHDLMRRARVAAVPSRWHENQPMAVLEAFACGLPVVTTGLGGLPELVEPGVDGAIVPANDPAALAAALTGILADPDRAHTMGKAARAKAERDFAPDVHLSLIRAVYSGAQS